jgi:predicted enzyme related to lactoylglutathione lyase
MNKLNFNSVMLFSEDPAKLSSFYERVVQRKPDMDEGGYYGFLVGQTFLGIGSHDKVKGKNQKPERFLLNFETDDVMGEFERIKALGVVVVAKPYHMEGMDGWIATFADGDGNYFQLMPPWKEKK